MGRGTQTFLFLCALIGVCTSTTPAAASKLVFNFSGFVFENRSTYVPAYRLSIDEPGSLPNMPFVGQFSLDSAAQGTSTGTEATYPLDVVQLSFPQSPDSPPLIGAGGQLVMRNIHSQPSKQVYMEATLTHPNGHVYTAEFSMEGNAPWTSITLSSLPEIASDFHPTPPGLIVRYDFQPVGILRATSLSFVPEPSTTVLLGVGIVVLACMAVRRRASQAGRV